MSTGLTKFKRLVMDNDSNWLAVMETEGRVGWSLFDQDGLETMVERTYLAGSLNNKEYVKALKALRYRMGIRQ